ncbi:uncharacterized protein LOC106176801 [Lingula anatina]|uniref:L-serine deaminase n=1 Tax=Lingula anatina TaxID=7574 RepID=A0A1S3JWK2_LINAN|nr:uncharacterized protein LOC106176801 [Lingula anatina]XP_013414797.1 uncharacterized protein LOC106176801 [Lingula anatina]XP_013414805.1 uncharacterized protein LOC106176801 [Lingula anatina]XP_013414813.1 uncharacterized protein LOC106176801 [Lingula anatina]|eukprot:XP_013414790.1 uncharacterized protein LOC106176801 [Lingula anatina]
MADEELDAEKLQAAAKFVEESPLCVKTPLIKDAGIFFPTLPTLQSVRTLSLKLENMQVTGSFKVRGVSNQLQHLPASVTSGETKLITMSAGNYGKAFAYATARLGLQGLVIMPETAPANRVTVIQDLGAKVERCPTSELEPTVTRYVKEQGMLYLHSFDDFNLVAGHGSLGIEILADLSPEKPDIVLVCCGGGGLVAGTAAAIKFCGAPNCRVYAVEPVGACTMYDSFKMGCPASNSNVKTLAAGLAPPYAGKITYRLCKQFVEEILLVTDEEIVAAVAALYNAGLKVEPSGAAAFAALMAGKVPDFEGKNVVVVLTGGNVTPEELCQLLK